jgi:hypothetical protein
MGRMGGWGRRSLRWEKLRRTHMRRPAAARILWDELQIESRRGIASRPENLHHTPATPSK